MILSKIHEYSPSSELADIPIGGFFRTDGKVYILLYRDPWVARFTRFTWFDLFVANTCDRLVPWLEKFKRKTK